MMRRLWASSFSFALALSPVLGVPSVVNSAPEPDFPELTAEAYLLVDADADVVLASLNADEERAMASVTKIMTALVVVDEADLDDQVRISASAASTGEAEIGLVQGERWTVRDLLAAVMVRSGNDAAVALAQHVGGSVAGFAELMNAKAGELGLEHSSFVNPHGLDEDGHYTSASDLAVMAEAAMQHPFLERLGRTRLITFRPDPSGVARRARNTNKLLGVYPGVVGLKTGFTNDAGLVLVAVHERNGRTLISVVMGSEDHFADTRELVDYGYRSLSLDDRFLVPLLAEQGGGASIPGVDLDPAARAQRGVIGDLPDGQWATTPFPQTGLGLDIQVWLRSRMPITLGGGS